MQKSTESTRIEAKGVLQMPTRPKQSSVAVGKEELDRIKWVRATSIKNRTWPTIRRRCPPVSRQRDWQTPTMAPPPPLKPRDLDLSKQERVEHERKIVRDSVDQWSRDMQEEIYGSILKASAPAKLFADLKREGFGIEPMGAWRNWHSRIPRIASNIEEGSHRSGTDEESLDDAYTNQMGPKE